MRNLERVREYCRQAGMKPDSPLQLALVTAVEAADAAREAAQGARGLTPEGEAKLIERVATQAAGATRSQGHFVMRDLRTRTILGAAGVMVAALLFVGAGSYWRGLAEGAASVRATAGGLQHAAFEHGPAAAAAWLQLMHANDPVQALAACKGVAETGNDPRRACAVPMWLDPPTLTAPGARS